MSKETITIKIYKATHDRIKRKHIDYIAKSRETSTFMEFSDKVLTSGLDNIAIPKKPKKSKKKKAKRPVREKIQN